MLIGVNYNAFGVRITFRAASNVGEVVRAVELSIDEAEDLAALLASIFAEELEHRQKKAGGRQLQEH